MIAVAGIQGDRYANLGAAIAWLVAVHYAS